MENSLSLFLFIGVEDFKRVKAKQGLCHKKEEHAVNLYGQKLSVPGAC